MARCSRGMALRLAWAASSAAAAAAVPTAAEIGEAQAWVREAWSGGPRSAPFAFVCGGRPSRELPGGWKAGREERAPNAQRRERVLTWSDEAGGLRARCVAVEYADFPVVEWTVYLKNAGGTEIRPGRDLMEGLVITRRERPSAALLRVGRRREDRTREMTPAP